MTRSVKWGVELGMAIAAAWLLVIAAAGGAAADDERYLMGHVRLTTEPSAARGCARITSAKDDSLRDLRRKIVRAGGNMAVLTFRPEDLSTVYADIYRCGGAPAGSAPLGPPALTTPPPPVGGHAPAPPPPPPPPPAPPMR